MIDRPFDDNYLLKPVAFATRAFLNVPVHRSRTSCFTTCRRQKLELEQSLMSLPPTMERLNYAMRYGHGRWTTVGTLAPHGVSIRRLRPRPSHESPGASNRTGATGTGLVTPDDRLPRT